MTMLGGVFLVGMGKKSIKNDREVVGDMIVSAYLKICGHFGVVGWSKKGFSVILMCFLVPVGAVGGVGGSKIL